MYINFGDIPGNHNLYLDYLYEFENVSNFYQTDFRNKEEYLNVFKRISENHNDFREQLSQILNAQYKSFSPSAKTQKNIDDLKNIKTLAVVTGQQLGLLGGPLYTFYKIMSAIKLSSTLSERYDEFQFVPVFWLEGDDHDFNEVRSVNVVDERNNLTRLEYGTEVEDEENRGSVGHIKFDETINQFSSDIEQNLRDTEFTKSLMAKIRECYSPGKTFKQSFKELIFWLFDKYGLIIFDPQDFEIKKRLIPVFKKELTDFRKHTEKLVHISAKLEELYHAQVKVRPVNLFYSNDEGRFLIEPVENEFKLRRKRKKYTYEELIELIENEPENFSPNVLLRPICQDYILPTAFYVGGPSEISYFAQVIPLYEFFGIEAPIIYPRSSVTLVERNISSIIEKFNIDLKELFIDPEKVKEKVIKSVSQTAIDEIFNLTANQIETTFDHLKEKLFELDKTISDASSKYKQKIYYYLDELKGKALDAQKKKYDTTIRQIDKAVNALYPNSNMQERELNFIYFGNKYGVEVFERIFEELTVNKFDHQIINL